MKIDLTGITGIQSKDDANIFTYKHLAKNQPPTKEERIEQLLAAKEDRMLLWAQGLQNGTYTDGEENIIIKISKDLRK